MRRAHIEKFATLAERDGARVVQVFDEHTSRTVDVVVALRDRWPNRRVLARYDVMSVDAGDEKPGVVEFRTSEFPLCRRNACDVSAFDCTHTRAVLAFREIERAAALDGRNDVVTHGVECRA